MEQRPLPDLSSDAAAAEPRLELVHDVDDVETADVSDTEEAEEAEEDGEEETAAAPKAEATQDPLKLYVRASGDGPLLTPAEDAKAGPFDR